METKELTNILKKLKDEDETKIFEKFKVILDFFYQESNEKYKDMIYEEYNRLSKDIDKLISEKN